MERGFGGIFFTILLHLLGVSGDTVVASEEVGGDAPAPRKLKLPGNHPRLDGNCLPIFSQNFALYYTIFTKLTSFKKQFIFFLIFLDFFQFFFRSTKNFHKKAATSDSKASLTGVEQRDASLAGVEQRDASTYRVFFLLVPPKNCLQPPTACSKAKKKCLQTESQQALLPA